MGTGAEEIPSAAAGDERSGGGVEPSRNRNNYRITDGDALGEGSAKEKFRQNVVAIELLRALETERRTATSAERSVLIKYTGWGGLPQVFATTEEAPKWKQEQRELNALLAPEEYAAARATVLNAHYTAPVVVRAMYAGVSRLGFTHGRVLEPACGLGHFFGLMPEEMAVRSHLTGIEIDPLTARLAAMLYPDAEIRAEPFEQATLPTNSFDLAISNVPFGDYAPFDPKFNARKFRIHDYFFTAALERVRPGGLVVFITSRGTLDKQHSLLRETASAQADMVAAIRLPNTAFKKNANTEVTTDIVFLRKRAPAEKPGGAAWVESRPMDLGAPEPIYVNEFFHSRVDLMLGRMQVSKHGMYGRNEPELVNDGRNLGEALAAAMASLPEGVYLPPSVTQATAARQTTAALSGVKPDAYALTELGEVAQREGNELVLLKNIPVAVQRRIRGMIRLREAVRDCLQTQVEERGEDEVQRARFRLNQDYDYFVGQFGPVSQSANVRAFAGDPDLPLLLSLENYDEDSNSATKTAIFHERTIQRRKPVERAESAKEALVVTLSEKGRVDLDHIGNLLGKSEEEFLRELQGVIFRNPESRRWETDDAYRSGNVRAKLAAAETAAKINPIYQVNVVALREVQPAELKATEIDARLGAVWVPSEDVGQFVRELLAVPDNDTTRVAHAADLGLWTVEIGYYGKRSVSNLAEWGTERAPAHELIEAALNLRTPTIYDYDEKKNPMVNATATEAAREKHQKIKDRFAEWVFQDDARRERLVALYNREFNCYRVRSFNGDHLTLPGASATITLRSHQKAAVWRILQTPNTLLAHQVGSGKTFVCSAAAMELKRLGLARKPMIVVPNHMLAQFSGELLMLYPNANILAAGKDDFEGSGRRHLMSRIATNNWDAVIVTHSGFERLPISAKAREEFFQAQLTELAECIRESKGEASNSRIVKQLETAKKRLEAKLKSLAAEHRKDNTLTFEELGIDRIFVDEAQAFKNLFYVTKMTRVAGLPEAASERAFDMFLKVQHIQRINGGGGVVFATGTPITNTMAEMFTMQRYLQMDVLRKQRLQHFDSWAATFGETVTAMELAPDGSGYRLNTRFARFVNVPELMHLFRQMADIQTAEMLKLPRPVLEGGKPRIVSAPSTPEMKALVTALAKRAERLKSGAVDPREDNMLKITGEGRKGALDLRLVRPRAADYPASKVNQAVREILNVWRETRDARLTQLVFCDLSTPKIEGRGFSVYQDIKAKLVSQGVPPNEVVWIQDYDSDAAKSALFKDVRTGKVRILLGSTQKMGAGTNVQAKLVALHHLDAPWRPADIEQREGRILRQGNTNAVVKIFRYVTEQSFDSYVWSLLENKARFIAQIMTGESTARRIEDLESPALSYAEVKAIASGNPMVIEKAKIDAEVMRLSRLRAEHAETQYTSRSRVRMMEDDTVRMERHIAGMQQDLKVRRDTHGENFRMIVDGKIFDERTKAGETLIYLVGGEVHGSNPRIVGELAGFKVEFRPTNAEVLTLLGTASYQAKISMSPVGIIMSLENAARSIDERIEVRRSDLMQTRKNLIELSALVGKPFEHDDHYRELLKRQSELVDALDITKNQASSRLAAESDGSEASATETPGKPVRAAAEESTGVMINPVGTRTARIAV